MTIELDIWNLPPPILEFGESGESTDPKTGLEQSGPFSLRFGEAHKKTVRLGLVGPRHMLDEAERWFRRCLDWIPSHNDNQSMYPDYPGFEPTFRSSLSIDNRWQVDLDTQVKSDGVNLYDALELAPRERFQTVADIYAQGIERLATSEIRPDVTVCCLPEEVVKACWSVSKVKLSPDDRQWMKWLEKSRQKDQFTLLEQLEPKENPEDLLYRDFRRALKARAMAYRMPIQIATKNLFTDGDRNQDPATRAWNVALALFYKAGGIPWRLKTEGPETCFAGISFHHLQTKRSHIVYSSLAQAFSSEGDGFALRGDAVPWNPNEGRSPHLSVEQAARLAELVLAEYRERTGREPSRMVLHKSSKFNAAERAGFMTILKQLPLVELVNIRPSMFRLVHRGAYPPARGTICRVNESATYLFTTGYIPEWGTYPGPHIPVPVLIDTDQAADINRTAVEILGLSRMNWNTARDTSGIPITLRFSREVGGIMAEVPKNVIPNPSYRYYM